METPIKRIRKKRIKIKAKLKAGVIVKVSKDFTNSRALEFNIARLEDIKEDLDTSGCIDIQAFTGVELKDVCKFDYKVIEVYVKISNKILTESEIEALLRGVGLYKQYPS